MSAVEGADTTAALRARLDDLDGKYPLPFIESCRMHAALRAVLEANREHREVLTNYGRWPQRAEECHCLGCESVRAIATSLGVSP